MMTAIVIVFWSLIILSVGGILADYFLPWLFAWDDRRKQKKQIETARRLADNSIYGMTSAKFDQTSYTHSD